MNPNRTKRRGFSRQALGALMLAAWFAVGFFPCAAVAQSNVKSTAAQQSGLSGVIVTASGQPVAGVTLRLSRNGQDVQTTTTAENGNYAFTKLATGAYDMALTLPEGVDAELSAQVGVTREEDQFVVRGVMLSSGMTQGLDFTATLLGTVQVVITEGETPVAGHDVALTDAEGAAVTVQTDDAGSYAFTGLAAGTYLLSLPLTENETVTAIDNQAVPTTQYPLEIVLIAGEIRDVPVSLQITSALHGTAAYLAAGENIAIASVDTQRSVTAAADGSFAFTGLDAGDYTVYLPLPQGVLPKEGSAWQITQQGDMLWLNVSVPAGESVTLPAAEVNAITSVNGVAYVDNNGDCRYTQGEQLMSNIPVALQQKGDDGWAVVAGLTTDAYGAYSFTNLSAGVYRVLSHGSDSLSVVAVGETANVTGDAEGTRASAELTLTQGDILSNQTDIALGQAAAIRVAAFLDSNKNGSRGIYERSLSEVTVEMVPASAPDGAAAASAVTGADGVATITGLAPGAYVLRVTLPDDYLFTVVGDQWSETVSCVGDTQSAVAVSQPLTLASGQTAEAGVGAVSVASFSGRAWIDLNNDGLIGEDEPGLANIRLTLTGVKTGNTYEITTDETGQYRFALLRNETYLFSAQLPEGYLFAHYTPTGGNARSVFTTEGTSSEREFIVSGGEDVTDMNVGVIPKATITGIAFMDTNYNGVYDEGEPPYEGVTIEVIKNSSDKSMGKVVTGADGSYVFTSLRGGDYRLRAILPNDGSIFTLVPENAAGLYNQFAAREGRRENSIQSLVLENGGAIQTCVGVAMGGSLSGTVFYDVGYDGAMSTSDRAASGVKIQLADAEGTIVATDTSGVNGTYTLQGIMPGEYSVRFLRRDGYAFTRYRPNEGGGNWVATLAGDGYGETSLIAIAMGENFTQINAGMLPSSTLTGVFFDDLNDNGLMDEGESGYTDGSVRLLSQDGEIDLNVPVGEDGTYFFDGVMPGQYSVTYLLPDNAAMASVANGGNTLEAQGRENVLSGLTVEAGKGYTAPLVGAVTLGSFEGYAYHDANGNGLRDTGEESMPGVSVTLTPAQASLQAAQTTADGDGLYSITGLRPGTYTLRITLPESYIFSGNLTNSGLSLDAAGQATLACPWTALTNRAQNAIGAVKPATVSASVWLDENRDGLRGDAERMLEGLTYELYDEALGEAVQTARAGADGVATFTNVRPATYTVRFALPDQAQPATGEGDFTLRGSTMSTGTIAVQEGETFTGINGGLVSYTSVGGTVVLDVDGTRTPQANVQVSLYASGEDDPLETVATDEQGVYRFDGLWPGEYVLEVTEPSGTIFVRPNDPNYAQGSSIIVTSDKGMGRSDSITLMMAQYQLALNVILIQPARVGDQVWLDQNRNGLIDAEEPSINGVTVELLENGEIAYTTVSNEWGYYEFSDVYPGTYTLKAQAYSALQITKSIPALRMLSSCLTSGDGSNAQSDSFSVLSGTKNFDFDLGYALPDGVAMPTEITQGDVQQWPVATAMP
ncbi:MAG: carboxypeptidase regulatory-like domain-containing protein [Eubacteriales bacterium]|nr:carboxypeptidase regulatory-like domain-containing protein [Eubacteriales bacterium]